MEEVSIPIVRLVTMLIIILVEGLKSLGFFILKEIVVGVSLILKVFFSLENLVSTINNLIILK